MKDLLKTNTFDVSDNILIIGSCLPSMEPKAFDKLKEISEDIYELCLECTHINMAITKIMGILSRNNIKRITFATVDKSPHCIQMHYIEREIRKAMKIDDVEMLHYVCVNDELIKISKETISKSKYLSELEKNTK